MSTPAQPTDAPLTVDPDDPSPVAVVTGATSGIGLDVARRLAARGCRTVLVARRAALLASISSELSKQAPSVGMTCDLADAAAVGALIDRLRSDLPRVDVLVNNAGSNVMQPFLNMDEPMERTLMQLHFHTPARLIRELLPGMLQRKAGHVINIASISAKMGPWGHGVYAAAKAALVSLTQTLAGEHAGSGVNFSYVKPGIVRTDFFDQPGYDAMADDVARRGIRVDVVGRAVVGLLDRPRLECCVPGHYRMLDMIKAISPGWAHRMVSRSSRPGV